MEPTVGWVADTLPYNWLTGKRVKYVHTVAGVAKVKYVPVSNNEGYTGMLANGADYGIIRFSSAVEPNVKKTKPEEANGNIAPGFGLKFLIDGQPSANLVTVTLA